MIGGNAIRHTDWQARMRRRAIGMATLVLCTAASVNSNASSNASSNAREVDPTGGMTGVQYRQFADREPASAKQLVLATSQGLIADHKVSHKFVCLPDGVTADRGPALLDDYLAHHKEQWGYTLHQLIFISWMTAFPC